MAKTEWTIATLKKYVEAQLSGVAKALKLQAKEYKRRLKQLNGEQARIAASQSSHVSRDTWDAFIETDQKWKAKTDQALHDALPRSEFLTYKSSTDTARDLAAGKWSGALSLFSIVLSLITAAGVVYAIFKP